MHDYSSRLVPSKSGRTKHYIFKLERIWSCVASTNGDAVGMPLFAFFDMLGFEFPERANYMYMRTANYVFKIRQSGAIINIFITDLHYEQTSLSRE